MVPFLSLMLTAAAAAAPYVARGDSPAWRLTIRDGAIRLSFGRTEGPGHVYGNAAIRERGRWRRWEAGEGVAVISVDARPGRCRAGGILYEDVVRVRLSGRELNGCGGQKSKGRRRR